MPDQELSFTRNFADLPDPRSNRTKRHSLHDILGVTVCEVICGADSFDEIARFGQARVSWLREWFPLPNGIPSHDTFNRVLAALDRKALCASSNASSVSGPDRSSDAAAIPPAISTPLLTIPNLPGMYGAFLLPNRRLHGSLSVRKVGPKLTDYAMMPAVGGHLCPTTIPAVPPPG